MMFTTENGASAGRLGQGTWTFGERQAARLREIASLKTGIEAGMPLIDTAEMYAEGQAERVVGEAIRGFDRASLFLVSKVYPHNAGRDKLAQSCEASLRRLGTEYLDLYLLHWHGEASLAETAAGMEDLKRRGLIRAWGVSNLDVPEMEALFGLPGGTGCVTNQVLYHLASRGIEYDLLPWMQARGLPTMAYSPVAQGGTHRRNLLTHPTIRTLAEAHNATPTQIALAFLLAQPGVIPIPRTAQPAHTLENAGAAEVTLTQGDIQALNRAFPAPRYKVELDML